jgi:hypothetical protein
MMNDRLLRGWKLVCLGLVAANVLALVYGAAAARSERALATRISVLEMNANAVSIVDGPAREKRGPVSAQGAARVQACLEWGPIAGIALPHARAEIARLTLSEPPIALALKAGEGAFAYYVREPDQDTVASFTRLQRAFPGSSVRAVPCP